jgi:hypothetical protein
MRGITDNFHMLDTKPMWKYLFDAKYINTIIFGKSVSQARKGEEGKFVCRRKTIFTCIFWATREEISAGKSIDHVVLEGNHCLAMSYAEKEACVLIKWDVRL